MIADRHWQTDNRLDFVARAGLTIGALLPYWQLLSFGVVYITDDYFISDIFNGELAGRVLIGSLVRRGELPVWTSNLCSGLPLGGAFGEPLSLVLFSLLSPAAALDLLLLVLLLVAAHGAYGLSRRLGADRPSAVLAGVAFAGSGYIAAQLKHLGIISTVVWLPTGLLLIDSVFADSRNPKPMARRMLFMGLFGLVFAEQALAGFPQSLYVCALLYGSFAVFCAWRARRAGDPAWALPTLGGLAVAVLLGTAAAAVVLLPLSELGATSDRGQPLGWEWATAFTYWPRNVLTFLVPYINGDISNNTYVAPSMFWEDYGYVGGLTFLLAIYGVLRGRPRATIAFMTATTVVAFLLVIGRRSPLFYIAYHLLPGMSLFRFPTRFLIVVELGLALLAAAG